MIPVLVLFGPTASGKTEFLARLSDAGEWPGETKPDILSPKKPIEIISADSMQVYRGLDIGTAKPSPQERSKIPHHLIDIRDPDEQFNAGDFVRLAEAACLEAAGRGALPVVSGGTGFYIKNLVQGLSGAPPSSREIRGALKKELAGRGAASLMEELAAADPVSAGRIHISDVYRLLRALEVWRLTGKPLSSFKAVTDTAFRFHLVGLRWPREELYRRINGRTAAMFRAGLPGEVRRLFGAGYTPADPGLRAIGYREFFVQDDGANGDNASWRLSEDLAAVEALVAQNSRRYAKRQVTFFASLPGVEWIECE